MESKLIESTRRSLWSGKRPGFVKRVWFRFRDFYDFIRDLPYNISKMLDWFPIIWRDGDWDFSFLLLLLKYKLNRIKKNFLESACYSEDIDEIINALQKCEDAIKRLMSSSGSYIEDEMKAHEKKWGKAVHELIDLENKNLSQLDIYSIKARAEGKEDIEREELHKIYDLEKIRRDADWNLLFDTMKNNIQNWWN